MESIDEELVDRVDRYIEALFAREDAVLSKNRENARLAGLPSINVSPNEGKLLYLLAKISGARRVLEVGTLGGYSTTWLARALPPDGKVITLEVDPKNVEVARKNLRLAGLDARVEVRAGNAADTMRQMVAAAEDPFDLVFIDADKPRYVEYLKLALELTRPSSLILADNVIRNGRVLEASPGDPNARGAKAFNEALAADPRLESIILAIYRDKLDGLSISRVKCG
jgi:predicted O-methyltransferase YrrM